MPSIDDPNRLDINLSLLPGESETAINALVSQLQGISNQLAMLKATDPGAAARAQLSMFQQTGMPLHGTSATASTPQGLRGGIDLDAHMRQAREEQETKRQEEEQRRQRSTENAEERRREAVRRKQQEDMDRIQREKYAELVAQQKLHTTGLVSGARHVLRGKRPDMGEDFTPQEQARAYERIEPNVGTGRNLINRTLQVLSPDVEPVDRGVLRQQAAQHAYEQVARQAEGGEILVKPPGGGRRSSGASAPVPATRLGDDGFAEPAHGPMGTPPGSVDPNAPAWMRHVSQQGVYAPMTMPRIGEFTAQDTLNMMGQWLGRRAYDARTNAGADASATTGFLRGSASAGFMRMAAMAPYLSNLAGNLSRRGFEVDHNSLEALAVLSGRGEIGDTLTLPGGFQVRDPAERIKNLAQAGLLEARFASAGMREGYLRSGQAVDIGNQLVRAGFGEEEAMNALRGPIGNVRGETLNLLDPEEIVNVYQQSIRAGGEPLSEFTRALSDLPHAARAARMSVDEMNASNLQFAETVQSMGGTFLGGYNRANAWAAMTGTAPQVGETLAQNPLVQGMAFGATGLLPQLQGMMDQGTATNVGLNTLNMLVNTYAGGMSDRIQKVPGGVLRVSARDQAIALAGQQLGLDREVTERLINNQEMAQAMGPIQGSIDAYLQDVEEVGTGRANRGAGQSGVSRRDIMQALRGAGFDDLSSLKGKSGDKFATAIAEMQRKRWEDIYGEASKSDEAPNEAIDVEIRLKGPAAKYLEATMANQPANLGRMVRDMGFKPEGWLRGKTPESIGEWAGSFLGG